MLVKGGHWWRCHSKLPKLFFWMINLIASFMGPTYGPPGSFRPQVGPMFATWILLSGKLEHYAFEITATSPRGHWVKLPVSINDAFSSTDVSAVLVDLIWPWHLGLYKRFRCQIMGHCWHLWASEVILVIPGLGLSFISVAIFCSVPWLSSVKPYGNTPVKELYIKLLYFHCCDCPQWSPMETHL